MRRVRVLVILVAFTSCILLANARTTYATDDPIERIMSATFRVLVNGQEVYRGGSNNGFATHRFPVSFRAGDNEVVVQLTGFFNVNFNWAGFALRVIE